MSNIDADRIAKEAAGRAAAELVQSGMIVGLGTGSTAAYFITHLGKRCQLGLQISAIATSKSSADHAASVGIPLSDPDDITFLDLDVDGADEIDGHKRMIKGGGGALLREKIVAKMSREMIVIVDPSKLVAGLGRAPLPVEIAPFAFHATLDQLAQIGFTGTMRRKSNGELVITENGNYIYDILFHRLCEDPEEDNFRIRSVTGVIETGFFLEMAGRVIVGYPDGHVESW